MVDQVKFLIKTKSHKSFCLQALSVMVPLICLPIKNQPVAFARENFEHLRGLDLADSGGEDEVDLLIGSDFYWELMSGKVRVGRGGEPVALESRVDWVLSGPVQGYSKSTDGNVNLLNATRVLRIDNETSSLDKQLHKFWDLETLGTNKTDTRYVYHLRKITQ